MKSLHLYERDDSLVLDLGLDVVNRIGRLDFEGDGLAGQAKQVSKATALSPCKNSRLNKDLHSTPQTKNEMKSRLLLNVVVGKSTSVLELFSGEDETLLVGGDTLPKII
jgi:hypothetical protein